MGFEIPTARLAAGTSLRKTGLIDAAWLRLGASADFNVGDIRCAKIGSETFVVRRERTTSVPSVSVATCPHRGAMIGPADRNGVNLRCPFHGAEFDLNGERVPETGPGGVPNLERFRVDEVAGQVMVTAHPDIVPASRVLAEDLVKVNEYEVRFRSPMNSEIAIFLAVSDNLFDAAHVVPVHRLRAGLSVGMIDSTGFGLELDLWHTVGRRRILAHNAQVLPGVVILSTPQRRSAPVTLVECIGFDADATVVTVALLVERAAAVDDVIQAVAAFADHHRSMMLDDVGIWSTLDTSRGASAPAYAGYTAAEEFYGAIESRARG